MSEISSCPSLAEVPITWAALGSNTTVAACSVPECNDNSAALTLCCNRYSSNDTATVESFNSISGTYLTCSISSEGTDFNETSTEDSTYQSFQDCLVQEDASPLLCNRPRENSQDEPTPNNCPVMDQDSTTALPPARVGANATGDVVCGLRNVPNATAVLRSCCGESPLQAYGLGCFASCVGDESLERCIEDEYDYEGDGNGPACVTLDESSSIASRSGGAPGSFGVWLASVLLMFAMAM